MGKEVQLPLNEIERGALAECEQQIGDGLGHFVTVGRALARIRDEKLYRDTHRTFEGYCNDRWDFGRNYGNKLIEASKVAEKVGTTGTQIESERQARELAKAPEKERANVWKQVTESKPKPTAADVRKAVEEAKQAAEAREPGAPKEVDRGVKPDVFKAIEDGGAAFDEIMQQIQSVRRSIKTMADTSHGAFIELQQVDTWLKNAWSAMKHAKPHAPCDKCGQRKCKWCQRLDGGGWLPYGKWKLSRDHAA